MDAPFSLLLSSLSRSVSHAKNARAGTTRAAKQARLTFTPCIALECFFIFVFNTKSAKMRRQAVRLGANQRSGPAKAAHTHNYFHLVKKRNTTR